MKVTYLCRDYPPCAPWGGVPTFYHGLSRALAQKGHEVHVICQAVAEPRDYEDGGIFVHSVGRNPRRYSALARIDYSFYAWLKLRELIRQQSTEIVETTYFGAEALLHSLIKSIPLVIRLDVSTSDLVRTKTYSGTKELLSLRILSWLEDFSARRADRVVAVSQEFYDRAINKLHLDPDKLDVVHDAIDTSRYRFVSSDAKEQLGISSDSLLVLFAGRLEARKGLHVLCRAIPKVIKRSSAVTFVLVGADTNTAPGGGSVKAYVSEQAKGHGFASNLVVLGPLPPDKLIQLYSACDVFVLPSLQEGFSGLVVLEALACGRPVVTTCAGGAAELGLAPPCGIIVPPNNASELSQAIVNLLSLSDEDRKLIAKKNRKLVEARFSIHACAEKMVRIYDKLLSRE